jgi:hypothetical protein
MGDGLLHMCAICLCVCIVSLWPPIIWGTVCCTSVLLTGIYIYIYIYLYIYIYPYIYIYIYIIARRACRFRSTWRQHVQAWQLFAHAVARRACRFKSTWRHCCLSRYCYDFYYDYLPDGRGGRFKSTWRQHFQTWQLFSHVVARRACRFKGTWRHHVQTRQLFAHAVARRACRFKSTWRHCCFSRYCYDFFYDYLPDGRGGRFKSTRRQHFQTWQLFSHAVARRACRFKSTWRHHVQTRQLFAHAVARCACRFKSTFATLVSLAAVMIIITTIYRIDVEAGLKVPGANISKRGSCCLMRSTVLGGGLYSCEATFVSEAPVSLFVIVITITLATVTSGFRLAADFVFSHLFLTFCTSLGRLLGTL